MTNGEKIIHDISRFFGNSEFIYIYSIEIWGMNITMLKKKLFRC